MISPIFFPPLQNMKWWKEWLKKKEGGRGGKRSSLFLEVPLYTTSAFSVRPAIQQPILLPAVLIQNWMTSETMGSYREFCTRTCQWVVVFSNTFLMMQGWTTASCVSDWCANHCTTDAAGKPYSCLYIQIRWNHTTVSIQWICSILSTETYAAQVLRYLLELCSCLLPLTWLTRSWLIQIQ